MAVYQISSTDAARKVAYEEKVYRRTQRASFFEKFMGDSQESMIWRRRVFNKEKGDQIYFYELAALDPTMVIRNGANDLRSRAQKLSHNSMSVTLGEVALPAATRTKGSIDWQRCVFDIDKETEEAVVSTGAKAFDLDIFAAITGSSAFRTVWGGDATSTATLAATDTITPEFLTRIKYKALTGERTSVSSNTMVYEPVKPIMIDGMKHLVLLAPSEACYDLERNTEFLQATREAEVRGKDNPLFKGAKLVWNGVIVHPYDELKITALTGGTGGDVPYCNSYLLGASAICASICNRPEIRVDIDDFEKIAYYAWASIHGFGATIFNSIPRGIMKCTTACTNLYGLS